MFPDVLLVTLGDKVVSAVLLVARNEIGVVDGRQGLEVLEGGDQLALQIVVQNGGALHGRRDVRVVDVPAADHLRYCANDEEQSGWKNNDRKKTKRKKRKRAYEIDCEHGTPDSHAEARSHSPRRASRLIVWCLFVRCHWERPWAGCS